MIATRRLSFALLGWLVAVSFVSAQSAPYRYDLLSLLPSDFAVCVVIHDLSGHSARWKQSAWLKRFHQSALGKNVLASHEMKQIEHVQAELKRHFNLDWPTVRDEILGDTLVLAYSPGAKDKADDERGLFLFHLKKPDRLRGFIDKLNEAQKKSGELTSLTEKKHQGVTYFGRTQGGKTQYYIVEDSLAVLAMKEEQILALLDRRTAKATESPWIERFKKAGAERALVTMCVNPRALDAELVHPDKKDDPLPSYWRALDAIFITATVQEDAELRISLQANVKNLPRWASPAFTNTIPTSSLWQRFPEQSILTVASQTDFAGAAEALKLMIPEKDRKALATTWQGSIGAILRVDLFKDLLPNIGPDWGMCVLPSKDANQVPAMMFALEVRPGAKEPAVDQTLFKAVEFFAGIAILDHNKKNPNAIISVQSKKEGNVEIKYLTSSKHFPAGFQPACALKDGFLIFATSPDAIADFKLRAKPAGEPKESALLRISTPQLSKLLEQRRGHILSSLTERQEMSAKDAKQNLENVIALLGLFDHVTLSQRGGDGQASWIIRLTPTK